ncbi:hypothetical protein C2869_19675 [Saccharobesus litoralis]|uniref:Uncharacterized protein n=1 Tax=Saccharobesus litoralis TaxID=2172099 RepID=A0A2S0VWD2_9ALTE|nr:hypothetical protein [Saccharobesus litoralis]AWB68483.1 hypothetical protein C2869_19675 [Saccharobesus litoralis]
MWAFGKIEDLQDKMAYFGKDQDSEHAIRDLAMQYSLVTDYTSMIVMTEEQFAAHNIDRKNKQRVGNEKQARQQRQAQGVQDNRVDKQQPMYNSPRPSHSGSGGSLGYGFLILILGLTIGRVARVKR